MSDSTPASPPVFLTADWRNLLMFNYDVPRESLEPLVPVGTTLDTYRGKAYISLIAFQFLNTRVKGFSIPFHEHFEEVNLRFYVRRFDGTDWRRGVVFIREIVPKAVIAGIARWVYNEQYMALPMSHRVVTTPPGLTAEHTWEHEGDLHCMRASSTQEPKLPPVASAQEFITEHYWGYTRQRDGSTLEYRVEHPQWRVWTINEASYTGNPIRLYGPVFGERLQAAPSSAFIAEGSSVTVYAGVRLPT